MTMWLFHRCCHRQPINYRYIPVNCLLSFKNRRKSAIATFRRPHSHCTPLQIEKHSNELELKWCVVLLFTHEIPIFNAIICTLEFDRLLNWSIASPPLSSSTQCNTQQHFRTFQGDFFSLKNYVGHKHVLLLSSTEKNTFNTNHSSTHNTHIHISRWIHRRWESIFERIRKSHDCFILESMGSGG